MFTGPIVRISLLLIALFLGSNSIADNTHSGVTLNLAMNEWKPWFYKENGKFKGHAYDIHAAVSARAGIPFNYTIEPWKRVYNRGLTQSHYIIGTLGRTPEREELFYWIGPVTSGFDVFLFKLKDNPLEIKKVDDLAGTSIGVIQNTYFYDFLVRNKLEDTAFKVHRPEQLISLLTNKRTQFVIIGEERLKLKAQEANVNPNLFEKSLKLFHIQDYMALSKPTPTHIYQKLADAYKELESEGQIHLH